MQIQVLKTALASELIEGEELIWSGRPEPRSKSAVPIGKKPRLFGGIFGPVALILFGVSGFFSSQGNGAVAIPLLIFGIFFFYMALVLLIVGFIALGNRFNQKDVVYAITNRRVIIAYSGRLLKVDSYSKEAIQQVRRLERPDESGDLLFLTRAGAPNGAYSNYNHILSGQGHFVAIANVRQVEKKLLNMLNGD